MVGESGLGEVKAADAYYSIVLIFYSISLAWSHMDNRHALH